MEKLIRITCLHDNDDAIAKKISWDGNKFHKESKASVKDGYIESAEFSLEEFRDYLTNIPRDGCIVLGKLRHGSSGKLVGSKEIQDVTKGSYSRCLDNFVWHEEYQLCCIDFDGSKAGNLTPDEVIAEIDKVMPGFAKIKKVIKYSSSAWIYDENDELLSGTNGFHIYFLVNHPELISEMFKGTSSAPAWLQIKLWLAGHGYIKNSKPRDISTTAITQLKRTICDSTVFSPERIIFEAEPILDTDLHKTHQEAFILEGSTEYLDLEQYKPITKVEQKEYQRLVRDAKSLNDSTPYMIECRKQFNSRIGERVEAGDYEKRVEYKGLSKDEIAEREFQASRKGILMQEHQIELASGKFVTPQDIMNDPKMYHNQRCKDPHEPDYGNSSIAIIYTNKKPLIFSQAHGGITYRFRLKTQENSVSGGSGIVEPDFHSRDYWLDHFYMVAYDKKDEIYHINGNKIEKYSHSGFNHQFAGYFTDVGDEENPKTIRMTKWWMNNINKKCISADGFAPGLPIIYTKNGMLVINEYIPEILQYGFEIPTPEECQQGALPWIVHIKNMIHNPEEADILVDWFAYLIQHPDERPMFAPLVLSETRGVGKDMMTDIFSSLIGHKFSKKSSIQELSKADGWGDAFYHTKLITVSECGSPTDRYTVGNSIKDAITTNTKSMNIKSRPIQFGRVYAGIIFFSNSISPFRLDEGDRRFFITRCDWSKTEADKYKSEGYFSKLASFYSDPKHLYELYHYLRNRKISTDMKGDAPMTSTKEIMMHSEPNETEQFFRDLRNHPCRYWTTSMIKKLYVKEVCFGDDNVDCIDNKQFKHFINKMVTLAPIKVNGKTVRLKTFSMEDAEEDNKVIRSNINAHWGFTTLSLFPACRE